MFVTVHARVDNPRYKGLSVIVPFQRALSHTLFSLLTELTKNENCVLFCRPELPCVGTSTSESGSTELGSERVYFAKCWSLECEIGQ